MAGFGPLVMTDELRREIVGMFSRGQSPEKLADSSAAAVSEKAEPTSPIPVLDQAATPVEPAFRQEAAIHEQHETLAHKAFVPRSRENVAMQNKSAQQQAPQRSHGRALPKS
jgi:hypothetical protein